MANFTLGWMLDFGKHADVSCGQSKRSSGLFIGMTGISASSKTCSHSADVRFSMIPRQSRRAHLCSWTEVDPQPRILRHTRHAGDSEEPAPMLIVIATRRHNRLPSEKAGDAGTTYAGIRPRPLAGRTYVPAYVRS